MKKQNKMELTNSQVMDLFGQVVKACDNKQLQTLSKMIMEEQLSRTPFG